MTTSEKSPNQLDLGGVWQHLSAQYDEQSLARAKQWVGKLMQSLATGTPTQDSSSGRQASLIYLDGLEDSAFFDPERFDIAVQLQAAFDRIESEISKDVKDSSSENSPNFKMFYDKGKRIDETFGLYPSAGKVLDNTNIPTSIGEFEVLTMPPNWKVEAHYGSTNAILAGHLAVHIPGGDCKIRVDTTTQEWSAGNCIVFDDTFEHELWNRSDETHRILVFSLWHPDLTEVERKVINFFYPHISAML